MVSDAIGAKSRPLNFHAVAGFYSGAVNKENIVEATTPLTFVGVRYFVLISPLEKAPITDFVPRREEKIFTFGANPFLFHLFPLSWNLLHSQSFANKNNKTIFSRGDTGGISRHGTGDYHTYKSFYLLAFALAILAVRPRATIMTEISSATSWASQPRPRKNTIKAPRMVAILAFRPLIRFKNFSNILLFF